MSAMVTETQRLLKACEKRPICRGCNKRIYSKYWQRMDDSPEPMHSECIKKILEERYRGHARWR